MSGQSRPSQACVLVVGVAGSKVKIMRRERAGQRDAAAAEFARGPSRVRSIARLIP